MKLKLRLLAATTLGLTGMLIGGATAAGELSVQAPVVNVEPLKGPSRTVEYCDDKPADDDSGQRPGLTRILAWDLGLNCRTERIGSTEITGYRVFYRWDDRVYSQVMASAPGATIGLTVRLD